MALYLCRWENGDFSVVQANDKQHAIEMLDEVGNAEAMPVYRITEFLAHFRLTDEGTIELEEFGEGFEEHIWERVYPALAGIGVSLTGATPENEAKIKAAVQFERERVKPKSHPEPDTELGKLLKAQTDAPTSVINRHVQTMARKFLRESKPKGKPN
jgi:hypothetical protein